jgi:CheY-like chemotaxis protein
MDEETLNHIFEPFYTTKAIGEGTGLGLATVYGIVKQNNGVVHVYSELDMGTTFKIYLPRHTGEATVRENRYTDDVKSGRETVLIVEDEAAILNLAKKYLEQNGYTVLAARNPMEAIGIAHDYDGEIDLLLSDVIMPGMDGSQLMEKLGNIMPTIRTMFMSGYSANVIEQRGILDKDIEFIEKPFTMRSLVHRIRRFLDRK